MEMSRLFSKEFLNKLQKEYGDYKDLLDCLIQFYGLTFHDAIVFLADCKKMIPEYLD